MSETGNEHTQLPSQNSLASKRDQKKFEQVLKLIEASEVLNFNYDRIPIVKVIKEENKIMTKQPTLKLAK